jgi:acyl-coenzyme A synthetase/AMP-(fatty) acid ligase
MAVYFGEPMTPDLSAEMRKAGFGAQREIYGSTETGLIGWRDSPGEPFVLFEHWKRADDNLERKSPSGEAAVLAPMDNLIWQSDRRFKLAGRRDGAVQIGAVNVFPQRIAKKIEEHPAVKSCSIAVSKHAAGANRLIANIELAAAQAPSESMARSIDAWCRTNLRQQERPRVYNFR